MNKQHIVEVTFARQFARDWIESWNAHDLARVLSHYSDDFEMASPLIARIAGEPTGVLRGKKAVGDYWGKALRQMPDLKFELLETFTGVQSICLLYNSLHRGMRMIEWFHFDASGKVIRAAAHHP